ncbi:MAG: translation initiation factor IF-2 N-terminal domain-containing protein, partial [Actinobacteria bacterium]|nr:translation initiation factor IF-2 N-terminal domain-containing protein [Actinomycetota bacterium]
MNNPLAKKIRVYELARELGLSNKEALDLSVSLGIGVKSHSSSIEDAQADRVRRKADQEGLRRPVEAPEPAVPAPAASRPEAPAWSSPIRPPEPSPAAERPAAPATPPPARDPRLIVSTPTPEPIEVRPYSPPPQSA